MKSSEMSSIESEANIPKVCDHTSVGILIKNGAGELLLIERKKPPFGFAPPAGHVDEHCSYEKAVENETREEVGLEPIRISFIAQKRKGNPCRRKGGTWHHWRIYRVETRGRIRRSQDETKQAGWYNKAKIKSLATKTELYLTGEITEEEWQKSPGLEPVWQEWFKDLELI